MRTQKSKQCEYIPAVEEKYVICRAGTNDIRIAYSADLEELKRVLQGKRGAAYNLFARKKISAPSIIESM
jgi:hypothetical protein